MWRGEKPSTHQRSYQGQNAYIWLASASAALVSLIRRFFNGAPWQRDHNCQLSLSVRGVCRRADTHVAIGAIALECRRRTRPLPADGALWPQMGCQVRSTIGLSIQPLQNDLTHRYKPLQLRAPLFCHSLAMVLLNAHIWLELLTASRALGYSFACQACRVSYSPHEMRVSWWQEKWGRGDIDGRNSVTEVWNTLAEVIPERNKT